MAIFLKPNAVYRQGAHTLPGEYFTSPDIYAEEQRRLFAGRWCCVGRAAELANPGEYRVVSVAGENLILVRGRDGAVRAFYNVCRHRGSRLCEQEHGTFSGSIQCPYHAWTYALDGKLIGAPHMHEVRGFDKSDYPLHAAAVDVWEGFLFVTLANDPEPLAEAFAPLIGRFARFNLPVLRPARRIEYEVRANWKLLCQNYSECLHCPVIHPALARLSPYDSGENDLVEGPFLGGFMTITRDGGSMTTSGRACAAPVGPLPEPDLQRVYYYSIFPNLLLSLHPDYVMYHTLWPRSPSATRVVCEWLFHPDAFDADGFDPDDAVTFWDTTNRQDWHVCEMSQAGVSSAAYTPGPYSPREGILAAWDREYLRQLGG